MNNTWGRKVISLISSLSILFQTIYPALFVMVPPTWAAPVISSSISFNQSSNTFSVSVDSTESVAYLLAYRTPEKTEAVPGSTIGNGTDPFQKDIYAGTCSTGGTCVPHQVIRGIIKTAISTSDWIIAKRFTINNGLLEIVQEEIPSGISLTSEETFWLENGFNTPTQTPSPTATPTPTLTPTVTPTPTMTPTPTPIQFGFQCITDTAGANDEPGQKDLNKMCVNYDSEPITLQTNWNWDDIGWTGSNSGDACNLFDTDGDGLANFSLCAIVSGTPATYQSRVLYSCGDGRADRCTSPNTIIATTSSCTASIQDNDPFSGPANKDKGDGYPYDTVGSCTIPMSDFGATKATLIDVCSYPSSQPNSDPSDCVVYKPKTGRLEVTKSIIPATDSGKFNLFIDNSLYAADVSNGGTTGEKILSPGTYSVKETAGTNTDLSRYTSAISCRNLNGTGSEVASINGPGPLSVAVSEDEDIVCKITNTLQEGTLVVKKIVINDNGGTKTAADFALHVKSSGTDVSGSPAAGSESGTSYTLSAGTYIVNEDALPSGYSLTGFSGDCDSTGSVSVIAGQTKTCTVVNNDNQPKLTVTKIVNNNNGGTLTPADFPLYVNDALVTTAIENGFNAGSYTVREDNQSGYTGVISGDCDTNGLVSLAIGETKHCTITNSDLPAHLIVIKHVSNDNGGSQTSSDFTMHINGITAVGGNDFPGQDAPGTDKVVLPGAYFVSETGVFGYDSHFSTDCSGTINIGETRTCTVTNDDKVATLTVIKHVENLYGGTKTAADFAMTVNGTNVSLSNFPGNEAGTGVTLNAGSYSVSENNLTGYASEYSTDCSGTIYNGESKTCTVTNRDIQPQLTVIKSIINDNGGASVVADFPLFVSGIPVQSGETRGYNTGGYIVSETSQTGYQGSFTGDCDRNGHITLDIGDNKTCIITNDDIAPKLTVTKVVSNNYGGTKQISDFPLYVGGISVTSGIQNSFNAGTYEVTENQFSGYDGVFSGDCDVDGYVVLGVGDTKSCTITNSDIPATITINKIVIPDTDTGLFNLQIDGQTAGSGSDVGNNGTTGSVNVSAGIHLVSETAGTATNLSEYSRSFSGDCSADGSLTVGLAENKTCTITNIKKGRILVDKITSPQDAGTSFDFNLSGGPDSLLQSFSLTDKGSPYDSGYLTSGIGYILTEKPTNGWKLDNAFCDNEAPLDNLTVNPGQTINCTFTNFYTLPSLTIEKFNNKEGIDINSGTDVVYTLTITANDNLVNNVVVKDTLPKGFNFKSGSVKVTSSLLARGDITGSITIPSYDTLALWNLGNMASGEKITIEYTATAGGDPGLYKDVAWTQGTDGMGGQVLGLAGAIGKLDTNFVGTQVNVVGNLQSDSNYTVNRTENRKRQVLGASTMLPATGANAFWPIFAIMLILSGSIFLTGGFMKKKTGKKLLKIFGSLFSLALFTLFFSGRVEAANLNIRLAEPKSPTYKSSFNVDFVVMDLLNRNLTVKCYKKQPGEAVFNQFGSDKNITGGTSGFCNTGDAPFGPEGTYQLKAVVLAGSPDESAESNTVSIDFKSSGPGTPTNYSKEKSGCSVTIKFRTADDNGKTVRAEIYQSENKSFNTDSGSRVKNIPVGSNQDVSENLTVSDCNKEYWFAVRAFDNAGNGSDVIGDTNTTTNFEDEIINVTPTPGTGAIAVSSSGAGTGSGGEVLGEKSGTTTDKNGKILGEKENRESTKTAEKQPEKEVKKAPFPSNIKWPYLIGGLLVLAAGIYILRLRK